MKTLLIAVILFLTINFSYAEQPKPPYKQDYCLVITSCKLVNDSYNAGNYFEDNWKIRFHWEYTYKAYPIYTQE